MFVQRYIKHLVTKQINHIIHVFVNKEHFQNCFVILSRLFQSKIKKKKVFSFKIPPRAHTVLRATEYALATAWTDCL